MDVTKLDEQLKALEKQFSTIDAAKADKVKQRTALDKQISELLEEQLRLQGEYRAIKKLIDGDKVGFNESVKPAEKK